MRSNMGRLIKIVAQNSKGEQHTLVFNSGLPIVKNEPLLLKKFKEYFEGIGWKLINNARGEREHAHDSSTDVNQRHHRNAI